MPYGFRQTTNSFPKTGVLGAAHFYHGLRGRPSAGALFLLIILTTVSVARGDEPPSLTGIDAEIAFTCGERNITVIGTNLQAGAEVRLTKAGETDVVASQVDQGNLQDNQNLLRCMFDLADGMAGGFWSIRVTNPDGQSDTLTDILDVISDCPRGAPGDLYVSNHRMWNILQFDGDTGAFVCIFADLMTVFGESSEGRTGELLWAPNGHLWVATLPPGEDPSRILEFDGETGAFRRFVLKPEDAVSLRISTMSFGGPDGNLYMQASTGDGTVSTRRYAYDRGRLTFLDVPLTVTPPMKRAYHARFASNGHFLVAGETDGSPGPTFREYDGETFELRNEWIDTGDKRGFRETPDGCCYAVVERNLNRVDLYDVETLDFVNTLIPPPEVFEINPCGLQAGNFGVFDPEVCWDRVNQLYDVTYGPNGHVFVVSRSTRVPRPSHITGAFAMGAVHEFDPTTGQQVRVIGRQDSFGEISDEQRDKLYHPGRLRFKPFAGDFTGVGTSFQGDWLVNENDLSRFVAAVDGSALPDTTAANLLSFDLNRDGVVDCADWPDFGAAYEASSGAIPSLPLTTFIDALLSDSSAACLSDCNDDGLLDGRDIEAYLHDVLN